MERSGKRELVLTQPRIERESVGVSKGQSCSFSTLAGVASSQLPQRVHVLAVSPQERARPVRGSHGASHFQHSSVKGAAPHFGWLGALGG